MGEVEYCSPLGFPSSLGTISLLILQALFQIRQRFPRMADPGRLKYFSLVLEQVYNDSWSQHRIYNSENSPDLSMYVRLFTYFLL